MSKSEKKGTDRSSDKAAGRPTVGKPAATGGKPPAKKIAAAKLKLHNKSQNKLVTEHPASESEKITDQDSSPENKMEVHHHPQLEHKPKPIKEYLLEGFMIFIAVMMGFIAENVRESITDREHVKQLTSQLVQDLKADTAELNVMLKGETGIVKINDTLITLLQQPFKQVDTRKIQSLLTKSHSMWLFHPSAGAMAAIKNELHLKQFSDSEIISHFAKYEGNFELLRTAQDINLQYQRLYLDSFLTQHLTPSNMQASFDKNGKQTAQMRNLTQADLDQLAADFVLIRIISKELVRDYEMLMKDAVDMLHYVTKQYGVKDE
ncbi:hypothetical protein KXD93_20390 [Mucilaginibacter sp. BJC16-A38]|uniref:hypothetical protein n=1 Tax=Mucilaginibacter phenanthrenivorans TaxID=1234842 RepID=UPI002157393A|nr:hypothetical protein [Mucilaginibacter phenanthrenivorans]MCR8560023.1 hypothetical protein [Mucilaginibacter phenanthrenivorans]